MRAEIEYLTTIFCQNGHDRKILKKIINYFEKKTRSTNNNNTNNTNKKQTIAFPWIPNIGPKIKKEVQKFRFRVVFQTGPNLKNISCKNKEKLIPNSYPGVCGSLYNGETKNRIVSRSIEHQQNSIKGNWTSSGATENTKECHGHFDR